MSGPPVVLVPGMLCTADLWRHQLDALPGAEVVELGGDSVDAAARRVLSVPHERFVLVGLSLGGIVAMTAALAAAPERIAGLGLVSTSARPPRPDQRAGWDATAARADDPAGCAEDLWPALVHPRRRDDAGLRERVLQMARDTGRAGLLDQLAVQRSRVDLRPQLPALRCPVVVVSGDGDGLAPPDAHAEIAALVPGATLVTVPGAGHLQPLEAPAEVTASLRALLPGRAPRVLQG